jgi:hypothetical protein
MLGDKSTLPKMPRTDMRAAGEVKGSGRGADRQCFRCGEPGRFLRDCSKGSKVARPADASTLLLIAERDFKKQLHNKPKPPAAAAGNEDKPRMPAIRDASDHVHHDSNANATTSDKHWRDDHQTVPDGPGWVFSTNDGAVWNQDVFKKALGGLPA